MVELARVVVDGSNLATEGRKEPSLEQLEAAVRTFADEHPDTEVIVVVDATFAHRIPPSQRAELERAELAGELVTPPAGTVGRGDAFVLRIADRSGAAVLSNDSFQEFHEEHPWLFEDGRLIGGKPVPGVGWIFAAATAGPGGPQSPGEKAVKAAAKTAKQAPSKRATKAAAKEPAPKKAPAKAAAKAAKDPTAKKTAKQAPSRRATKAAAKEPAPKKAPAKAAAKAAKDLTAKKTAKQAPSRRATKAAAKEPAPKKAPAKAAQTNTRRSAQASASSPAPPTSLAEASGDAKGMANDALPFISLLAEHPLGSELEAEVVSFTSHGAMVDVDLPDGLRVHCYLPLTNMADPAPRRAREVLNRGEAWRRPARA